MVSKTASSEFQRDNSDSQFEETPGHSPRDEWNPSEDYTRGGLNTRIGLTLWASNNKDSKAKEFRASFQQEKAYLQDISENNQDLHRPFKPDDPHLTPFIQSMLDEHPMLTQMIFAQASKEEGGLEKLAQQIHNYWNLNSTSQKQRDQMAEIFRSIQSPEFQGLINEKFGKKAVNVASRQKP